MSSVRVENVTKNYGNVPVIHGVDLEIEQGEFVILVGPSGCGKSTLLRMIAGLETITSGAVVMGERVVNTLPPKDRDIAMVFQNYALYPQMSVAQNMGFSLEIAGFKKPAIQEKVNSAAQILGLEDLLERKPAQLSGGQRQRVAMGRAIVRDPKVFLFDEPLSNLDAKLRVQMRTEIKDLQRRLGTTTIYVTHDQIEAMTMADKIVVMREGLVEQIGSPLDLYDHPANMFVASFIGSPAMNFLEGTINDVGELTLESGAVLAVKRGERALANNSVFAGVRPEHFVIDPKGPVKATVGTVEPTGSETFLAAKVGATDIVIETKDRVPHAFGDEIRVSVDPDKIHLFDRGSEEAII